LDFACEEWKNKDICSLIKGGEKINGNAKYGELRVNLLLAEVAPKAAVAPKYFVATRS
jgi:hypothetical protein